jgi:hypothetical protein
MASSLPAGGGLQLLLRCWLTSSFKVRHLVSLGSNFGTSTHGLSFSVVLQQPYSRRRFSGPFNRQLERCVPRLVLVRMREED